MIWKSEFIVEEFRCGVVDKPLSLYPGVCPQFDPGSHNLLDETKPCSPLQGC